MELLEIISLNWPAALCLIAGFVLVTVEMFTPGFGVPGISGLALLLIALGSLLWPMIRDRRAEKKKASGQESEVDKMSQVFDVEED